MALSERSLNKLQLCLAGDGIRLGTQHESASEAGSLTYYPSILCQIALPSSEQKGPEYARKVGRYRLSILTPNSSKWGIPFGAYARGILNHIATEVIRAKNQQERDPRFVVLGDSLTAAVERVTGKVHTSGGPRSPRELLERQLLSLVNSTINFSIENDELQEIQGGNMSISSRYAQRPLWKPQLVGSESPRGKQISIYLGEEFYADLVEHAAPIDERIMRALWPHCMQMDIYTWLTYRANAPKVLETGHFWLSWSDLMAQFGGAYSAGSSRRFRQFFLESFEYVRRVYHPHDREYVMIHPHGERVRISIKGPSVRATGTYSSGPRPAGISAALSLPRKPKPPTEGQGTLL